MHFRVLAALPLFGLKGVRDFLSVRINVGFVTTHSRCANSRNAIYFAKKSFEYMDILSCAGGNFLGQMPRGCTFSALTVFSDRDCPQS